MDNNDDEMVAWPDDVPTSIVRQRQNAETHARRTDLLLAAASEHQAGSERRRMKVTATRAQMSTIRGGIETQLVARNLGEQYGLRSQTDGNGHCFIWLDPNSQVPKSRLTRVPRAYRPSVASKRRPSRSTTTTPISVAELIALLRQLLSRYEAKSKNSLFQ